ncbi:penicillin-binding protein, 1A family [Abditibacterium utsteinense]|uniref:Penicillin-binding protein, 1A family n=1 Tax=Abditibacterium utsteinense TaxID=1960156 RepID=A0A2S8SSV9_9BACT|nr:PBP1A family penicillin-binding protein [Abditibacterium utsteinense]PQV63904.1 penicillin-binding protein, 1A family [Abditibacterium utsteinense]
MASASLNTPLAAPKPKFRHSFWWYLKWFFITLTVVVFCGMVAAFSIGKGLYDELGKVVPDINLLMARNKAEPTRVYAIDGSLLAEFRGDARQWIPLSTLKTQRKKSGKIITAPGRLIDATLSIEDARFYTHPGMDPKRIGGALLANYRAGGVEQGGSTITEQLAKNVYLSQTRTVSRRLQTAFLALQLEKRLSKDEILEAYLNEIYYGNRAYGCEAAAQTYFGKHAKDLTIAEAALVGGLPQSPSRLDPFDHFDNAKERQKLVLGAMLKNQRITYAQFKEALADKTVESDLKRNHDKFVERSRQVEKWKAPYFVSYVRTYLEKQYGWSGDYLNKSGLKIYTTLDPKLQKIAENVLVRGVRRHGPELQGALVSIDPWTGHVVAMVGGKDYYNTKKNGQWNRAVQGKRQPGSTMKPYIYAAAMEAGYTPDSVVVDSPLYLCGDSECPPGRRMANGRRFSKDSQHEVRNYDRTHHGAMTMRSAIAMSNNVVATRTLLKVGIQNVIQKAHLMGVSSPLSPYPSLALGTSDLSLLEHVSAYGVFATRGLRAEATPVIRVENYAGDTLVEQPMPVRGARVISPPAANNMWQMLRYVVTNGTGRVAQIPGVDVIGKTGTTSSNKDVWFMGASKDLVTGVWMGYDRPRNVGAGSAGGLWCGPVWRSFMVPAIDIWRARKPVEKLVEDARATAQRRFLAQQYKQYVRARICDETGLLATKECPQTHLEVFSAAGGAPTQFCDVHRRQPTQQRDLGASAAPSAPGDLGFDPARSENEPPAEATNPEDSGADSNAQPDADMTPPDADLNAPARREYRRDETTAPEIQGDGVTLDGQNGGGEGRVLDDSSGGFLPPDNAPETPPVRR